MVLLQSGQHLKAISPEASENFRPSISRVKTYFFLLYLPFDGCGRGSNAFGVESLHFLPLP